MSFPLYQKQCRTSFHDEYKEIQKHAELMHEVVGVLQYERRILDLKVRLCLSAISTLAAQLNCGTNHAEQLSLMQASSSHSSIDMFDLMH